jgi:hypothetical protein
MPLLNDLSALALAPLLRPALSTSEPMQDRDRLAKIGWLAMRLAGSNFPKVLQHAAELAWQTLEYLLAAPRMVHGADRTTGETRAVLDRFAAAVGTLSRGQPTVLALLIQREEALAELRLVRKSGLLLALDSSAGGLLDSFLHIAARTSEQQMTLAEGTLVAGIVTALSSYPRLADWFRQPQPGYLPLVVQAMRLHFQRDIDGTTLLRELGISPTEPPDTTWTTPGLVQLVDVQRECGERLARLLAVAEATPLGTVPDLSELFGDVQQLAQMRLPPGITQPEAVGFTQPRLPAPAAAPVPPAAPPPAARSAPGAAKLRQEAAPSGPTDLRRRASIRWYRRMNPERMYPLTVVLSRGRVQEVRVEGVGQAVSAEQLVVSASHPFVVVRPVLPGIECYPAQQTVDVTPDLVTVRFRVVARMLGKVEDGRIELYARDRLLSEVPLDVKVVRQTVAVVVSVAGLVWPLLGTAAQHLGMEVKDSQDLLARGLQAFLALPHAIEMGFAVLLLVALLFYWWNRPRLAGKDTDVLAVRPMSLAELLAAGRLEAARKQWAEAASFFEDAVNVDPGSTEARAELEAVRAYLPGTRKSS